MKRATVAHAAPEGPSVLVVEDDPVVAHQVRQNLSRLGYRQIAHTTRGEDAIALAGKLRPDVVLMDIHLAGNMDGIEAAQAIRRRFALPVVFVSGSSSEQTVRRAKRASPFGYILKPFSEEVLGIVLRMALYSHQVEAKLRESEERYRTLIDWSPDPLAVYRDQTVLYVNPAAVEMMGATGAADLVGRSILDFVHPAFRGMAEARIRSLLSGAGTAPPVEMKFLRQDGSAISVETQSVAIPFDGEMAIQTSMRDMTARRQAEAARDSLEAQLRASHKVQALGTLASGVAHDFNNILAIVLANLELAQQDTTHARAIESLDEARRAALRGRELVRQILAFGRPQATEKACIQLASVIEEGVRLLRATLPAGLAIEVRCEGAPSVWADAAQIQQVLTNLATNAQHAMSGRSGCLAIRLDSVGIDAALLTAHPGLSAIRPKQTTRCVRLTVSDNGSGMDEATLARAFEPFFTTKRRGEGSGLGLSVVQGIVEGHDGAIVAESEPGKGSTFTLYLPAALSQPGINPRDEGLLVRPIATPQAEGRRILYVDDQESLVRATTRLLARRGYRVSGHTDPDSAIRALRDAPTDFDIVVTDYNMPGMSGLELANIARGIRPDLPIVLASGFLDPEVVAEAAEAGIREVIVKASTMADFCATIERVVSDQRAR